MANVFDQFDESQGNVFDQFDAQPQVSEPSLGDQALGALEAAATIGSSVVAEPLAGWAGAATDIARGSPIGAIAEWAGSPLPEGADVVGDVQEALTYQPRTEAGRGQIQAVGEALAPVGEAFGAVESGLGEAVLDATGIPELAAVAHTLPTAALEALGVVAAMRAPKAAARTGQALERVGDVVEGVVDDIPQLPPLTGGGKAKARIRELIEEGSADVETARYSIPSQSGEKGVFGKLGEKLRIGSPDVVKDPLAGEAIKQGFDEGVIAAIKASTPQDRAKMADMARIMERGKKNKRFAMENRPSDIVGDSLMERVRVIQSANKSAGKELDSIAKGLRGERVDFSPAVDSFISNLDDMGIAIGDDLKPNFAGSDIEGVTAAENAVSNIVRRMTGKTEPDAYDVHRMKRFIDEHVSYGKSAEGLTGKTEGVLKDLRRELDSVLDNNFPEYDRVNTQYAETIGALDALQGVAGKKMDLTGKNADKATGTLMRRVMSNAQSRVNLVDAIDQIEGVANKYIGASAPRSVDGKLLLKDAGAKSKRGFTDDLLSQVLFADELDAVFKPVARTSLEGAVARQVGKGAEALTPGGRGNLVVDALGKAAEKARGINEENAFKAIQELLKGGQ